MTPRDGAGRAGGALGGEPGGPARSGNGGPGDGWAGDYEVGYGKPPAHTRFKPGQSGNPSGRPKGPRSLARDLLETMQEPVTDGESAARETLSTQRAILRALSAKALAGDAKAADMVLEMVERLTWAGGGIARIMQEED